MTNGTFYVKIALEQLLLKNGLFLAFHKAFMSCAISPGGFADVFLTAAGVVKSHYDDDDNFLWFK